MFWFTPREVRHLPWRERERLTQEAADSVRRHPRFWLWGISLPMMVSLIASWLPQETPRSIRLLSHFPAPVLFVTMMVWNRKLLRQTLRQKLLDAGFRPAFCFECGRDLQGYEGSECPACKAPLLRQTASSPGRS